MAVDSSKRDLNAMLNSNSSSEEDCADRTPPTKKARTSNSPDPVLWKIIRGFPPATTQKLLYELCTRNSTASQFIYTTYNARLAEEAARPPANFDSYAKACWYTLNIKYKRFSSSKQCDIMGDVIGVLSDSREAILKQAGRETKWETRRNALEVLRRICKSIMLCDVHQIRHELMKDSVELGDFAAAMTGLAQGMTMEERRIYAQEGLYDKLLELRDICDWEVDMEGLADLYSVFERSGGSQNSSRSSSSSQHSARASPPPPPRTKVFTVEELS